MSEIMSSASKIAFLMLMGTACAAFFFEVVTGRAALESKDFMVLASGAAAFYFAYKGSSTPTNGEPPFAGK